MRACVRAGQSKIETERERDRKYEPSAEHTLSELSRLSAMLLALRSSSFSGLWHSAHVPSPALSRSRMQCPQNVWWHGVKTGSL